ncbi:MAG TPA: DUF3426 domain-containing protein [Burkholderiales bacterium]|nr:DUF3426 domain-containing protein [Burkholderiales bacterium]
MSLITRCPTCATAFRVVPGQLAARAGRVRCGKCGAVFDGIQALVEEGGEPLLLEPSPQLGLFDPSRRPDTRPPDDTEPLPAFMAEELRPRRRALSWTLSALAALALAAQATYHYRAEIAAGMPWARAPLDEACRRLGCEVPLPRQLSLLSIDSYEVRADPQRDGVIVLNAVIRNKARFAQAFPALQFALTDDAGRHIVSRVLAPRDYLDAGKAAALIGQGIEPGGDAALTVYFDTSRTRASGYRLELFYPS